VGKRMPRAVTRAIIDATHGEELCKAQWDNFPVVNMSISTSCSHMLPEVLHPEKCWADQNKFNATVRHLASLFIENFKLFGADPAIAKAGPTGAHMCGPRMVLVPEWSQLYKIKQRH
jgi:phosphoenolpyruvate carboxykinase (ATP)